MTPRQRSTYFGTLWPAACKAQGWNVKDEERRKDVTHAATGKESTSGLNENQITLLFNKLKWLADPTDFDRALADANPDLALEENQRVKIIFRIRQESAKAGLKEKWIEEIAAGKCAANNVKSWTQIPTVELLKLSMTVESRTSEIAKEKRALKGAKKRKPAQAVQEPCMEDAEESSRHRSFDYFAPGPF